MIRRGLSMGALLVFGLALFKLVSAMTPPRFDLQTPLDHAIPFLPLTLPVYLALFPCLIAAALLLDAERFRRLQTALFCALVVGLVCFALLPAAVNRPDPALIADPFFRQRFTNMWRVDAANNTFPSLHVASTWLVAAAFGYRAWWLVLAVLISAATLTVKQHTIADVCGGFALALLTWRATRCRG